MLYFYLGRLLLYGFVSLLTLYFAVTTAATLSFTPFPLDPSKKAWEHPAAYPKGKFTSYRFKSRLLKNKRDIWVYLPASYQKIAAPYPLLIVFDGQAYTSQLIPGPTILDNLIGSKTISPLVAVFVSSIGQCERNRELPCYAPFIDSLTYELLPWLHTHYHVTSDPAKTIVAGSSYGGLAAAYAALRYPDHFGNVLSQSGAFWWQSPLVSGPWLVKQYASQPLHPIRFYLDVGDQEIESEEGKMSMVQVNRHFRDLLINKGYHVTYHEFQGGHDYACWRKTLAIGLIALMRGH